MSASQAERRGFDPRLPLHSFFALLLGFLPYFWHFSPSGPSPAPFPDKRPLWHFLAGDLSKLSTPTPDGQPAENRVLTISPPRFVKKPPARRRAGGWAGGSCAWRGTACRRWLCGWHWERFPMLRGMSQRSDWTPRTTPQSPGWDLFGQVFTTPAAAR